MLDSITNFIFYHTPLFYLTQSFWRDEAFSYFMAKPDILQVIRNTALDFNPPLYYLLLHFWMKLAGQTDELLRLLSLFPHLATCYIAYFLAKKMFSARFAIFVAIFTFLNPMLLYYAFELRMYSLYAFFSLACLYFFYTKKWKWYTVVSVLGLYTHSFFSLILVSQILFLINSRQFKRQNIQRIIKPVLFFLPWFPVLINQFFRSKDSWMFPVDFRLVRSVLGNLFTGFEGTPGNWWAYTGLLSLIIIIFMINSCRRKRIEAIMLLLPVALPLTLILGYSLMARPIYVNRYLIFITVFEIMAVAKGIWDIKNKSIRTLGIFFWLILVIFINFITPIQRKKTDFKSTFMEINHMAKNEDFVYAATPIGFLESAYYYKNPDQVFVYNPDNVAIPNYIGVTVVFADISKSDFPLSPSKTFLVNDDASYQIIIKSSSVNVL